MEQDSWFNPNITYGTLTDERDGQTYRTVVIGTQNWMAENLHYAGENASEELAANMANEVLCPSGDEEYCEKAGYVYSWTAAMNLSPTYATRHYSTIPIDDVHQGICPKGWHVPTQEEWGTLFDYAKTTYGESNPINALKTVDSWVWFSKEYAPTNETGFSILSTGQYYGWGSKGGEEIGKSTFFITATTPESQYYTIELFYFNINEQDISNYNYSQPAYIRCVENAAP